MAFYVFKVTFIGLSDHQPMVLVFGVVLDSEFYGILFLVLLLFINSGIIRKTQHPFKSY